MLYQAPSAHMVAPSRRLEAVASQPGQTLPNTSSIDVPANANNRPRPKSHSNRKTVEDQTVPHGGKHSTEAYQAEADAIEADQARKDPDYSNPRSGKRKRGTGAVQPTEKKPPKRSGITPYNFCSPETQRIRDQCIAQINRDLGPKVEKWLPRELIPAQPGRLDATRKPKALKLKDWSKPLLRAVAQLATCMPKQADRVSRALANATRREGRRGTGGPITTEDVMHAIDTFREKDSETPSTLVAEEPDAEPSTGTRWTAAEPGVGNSVKDIGRNRNEPAMITPRSPYFDDISPEDEHGAAGGKSSSGRGNGIEDGDDDREVSELDELRAEMEAKEARLKFLQLQRQVQNRR